MEIGILRSHSIPRARIGSTPDNWPSRPAARDRSAKYSPGSRRAHCTSRIDAQAPATPVATRCCDRGTAAGARLAHHAVVCQQAEDERHQEKIRRDVKIEVEDRMDDVARDRGQRADVQRERVAQQPRRRPPLVSGRDGGNCSHRARDGRRRTATCRRSRPARTPPAGADNRCARRSGSRCTLSDAELSSVEHVCGAAGAEDVGSVATVRAPLSRARGACSSSRRYFARDQLRNLLFGRPQ